MLLLRDASGWVGRYREVALDVWRDRGDLSRVLERQRLQQQLMDELAPKKIITVTIVHERAIRPIEPDLREAIGEFSKRTAPMTKAAVTVVAASGLKAAIVRGIIASVTLVSRVQHPVKVASTEAEGFEWLGAHLEAPGSVDELSAAYREHEPS